MTILIQIWSLGFTIFYHLTLLNLCIFGKVIFIVDHHFLSSPLLKPTHTPFNIYKYNYLHKEWRNIPCCLWSKLEFSLFLRKLIENNKKRSLFVFLKGQKEWVVFKEEFWLGSITLEYRTVLTLTSVSSLEFVMYEGWRIKELRLVSFIGSVIQDLNRRYGGSSTQLNFIKFCPSVQFRTQTWAVNPGFTNLFFILYFLFQEI